MSSPDHHQPHSAGSSDDLKGLDILLVEDSRDVGEAVKKHLELLGAKATGPAATTAEAEGLLNERPPDVALVDLHLRDGELSDGLIGRLHEQGVPVIMLSGSFGFSPLASVEGTTFLEKPVSEAQLLAHLGPLIAKKATR
jgi:DNA-binding response OmpR family regulator